jgi:hypothetical protein
VGTPQYMAPEQIRQEADIGPKADIYGLGAVLFKMLTGRLPFESESLLEIVKMHLGKPAPRPSEFAKVSERMDAIVLACLEKDPARRPASMLELREWLRPIAEQLGPDASARIDGARVQADTMRATAAKGLQTLARSAREPKTAALRRPKKKQANLVGRMIGALMIVLALAVALVAFKPWERRDTPPAPTPPAAPPDAPVVAERAPVQPKITPLANGAKPAPAAAPNGAPAPAAAPAPAGAAAISIQTDPPGAEVFVDHVRRGVTPLDLAVPPPVEIKLTLDGYKTVRKKITRPGPVKVKLTAEGESGGLPQAPAPEGEPHGPDF